ncbi:hypothetical protein SAMN05421493_11041 [Pseudobutyrivibrio sp. 49]|nr:hypothetical protein SAMN05421493_11041 [Pseudobutyrivibrio sp. 49]
MLISEFQTTAIALCLAVIWVVVKLVLDNMEK